MKRILKRTLLDRFLHSQSSGSIVLMIATIIALFWANSRWSDFYRNLSHLSIGVVIGEKTYRMGLAHWIKDGLMTIFFFVVGLEIKREVVLGELSSFRKAILPILAAVGGCIVPAIIYYLFNRNGPSMAGWGIPMATDIAFAIGILALLGDIVPSGLKIFLTALAIVDDLIAVLVIAIFYTSNISIPSLIVAGVFLLLFFIAVALNARRPIFYLVPAIGVWVSIMFSGIHATIAGVLIALLVPVKSKIDLRSFFDEIHNNLKKLSQTGPVTKNSIALNKDQWNILEEIHLMLEDVIPPGIHLENYLHSVQAFVILPLFALFSAGVTINEAILATFPSSISLGIIFGLLVGKPVGILLFSWIAKVSGLSDLPEGVKWGHILGVGTIAGIGFTISIFISELGFSNDLLIGEAKIGVFIASLLAGTIGYVIMRKTLVNQPHMT